MRKYLVLIVILFSPWSAYAAEDLSHITGNGGTVYFADDFEHGGSYLYLGATNAHPGGGYWSNLGGTIDGSEGSGCSDASTYHNTIISNDTAAQGAVTGSSYSLKTPYDGDCTGESTSRDRSILDLGSGDNAADKSEIYVRWYQKFTGDWNSSTVQHKFTKFCGNAYNGTTNSYMTSAHFSFDGVSSGDGLERWWAAVNNYNGQFDSIGCDYCTWDEVWVFQSATDAGHYAYDNYNNGLGAGGADVDTPFTTNKWYCIEIHVKMNSSTSAYDAVQEAWIDGQKVFGLSEFQYYTSGQSAFGVGYLEFQHIYYIRTATDQPTYMDNIVVADQYIGPLDSSPAPAPPTLSNVTISGGSFR